VSVLVLLSKITIHPPPRQMFEVMQRNAQVIRYGPSTSLDTPLQYVCALATVLTAAGEFVMLIAVNAETTSIDFGLKVLDMVS